jgi:hypothetical protein
MTLALICGLCTVAGLVTPVHADVVDFEAGFSPLFTYTGVSILDGSVQVAGSGYQKMAAITPGTQVSFDPFAVSPSTFTWANPLTTFNLDSMLLAGAWGSQTLTLKGYKDGIELFSEGVFVTPDPTVFSPSWQDLDEFRIYTGGDHIDTVDGGAGLHWVMDNLVVETCEVPAATPEPGSMALLGAGALGLIRRRKLAKRA